MGGGGHLVAEWVFDQDGLDLLRPPRHRVYANSSVTSLHTSSEFLTGPAPSWNIGATFFDFVVMEHCAVQHHFSALFKQEYQLVVTVHYSGSRSPTVTL